MALKQIRIGSMENVHQFDDVVYPAAMNTDGIPIEIGASTAGIEAVRQDQLPVLGQIVSSSVVITDHAIVRGDGGARGVQDSLAFISDAGSITLPALQTVDGVDISVHAANVSAHHVKYTDAEALAAVQSVGTFVPTAVGFTVIGAETISGHYIKTGKLVTIFIYYFAATSIAIVGTTSYFSNLPYTPATESVQTSMWDDQTVAGTGLVTTTGRIYFSQSSGPSNRMIVTMAIFRVA